MSITLVWQAMTYKYMTGMKIGELYGKPITLAYKYVHS